jgi:hypothetical protein
MDNVRKTAWEQADEDEEQAKQMYLEEITRPSQYKVSINNFNDLDMHDDNPIKVPSKSNNLTIPTNI